jgi:hypothetical protein
MSEDMEREVIMDTASRDFVDSPVALPSSPEVEPVGIEPYASRPTFSSPLGETWNGWGGVRDASWKDASSHSRSLDEGRFSHLASEANVGWSDLAARCRDLMNRSAGIVRSNALILSGIATGVGFGLGLLGRYARHNRRRNLEGLPLLIVEPRCS